MSATPPLPPQMFRRKKEHRRGIHYTIMLCGSSGTGKTTFANNLLESELFPHQYEDATTFDPSRVQLAPRVRVTNPTKVVSFNSNSGIPSFMTELDPARAHVDSGITITSTSVEIMPDTSNSEFDEDEPILFTLLNTHGLGDNLDDSIAFGEVASYLEQQFDIVLAEETRIKRNPRFEDTRVHVILYFLQPTGHGLREMDIEMMKKMSRYTNVLPIISRADSFTKEELSNFRKNILEDIERYNIPVYKFEVDPEDDDPEAIEENRSLAAMQPFAVVCSEIKDKSGKYIREYPWGTLEIDDDRVSDLLILKNVLFGSHLQEFKDTTQSLLYENYRAERLTTVTAKDINMAFTASNRQSAAPSLSNFASLIKTGQFQSTTSLSMTKNNNTDHPSTPDLGNDQGYIDTLQEESELSPHKEMYDTIKLENKKIINDIKSTSPDLSSAERHERSALRNISETVPYVLRHERVLARQQKLEELEAQSAKELQKRIQELERKAHELKLREKILKQNHSNASLRSSVNSIPSSQLKKGDTYTDLASIASNRVE